MTWNELSVQASDATQIAEALINGEVTLNTLNAISTFQPRKNVVDDEAWNKCKTENMPLRYKEVFPDGNHINEIEDYFWNCAVRANTSDKYIEYREQYPDGVHLDEADDCVWSMLSKEKNYFYYISLFPHGKHVDEVEDLFWDDAEKANTLEKYKDYINYYYPHGKHISKADDRVWEIYLASNNYQGYLDLLPNGNHSDEARSAKREIDDWNAAEAEAWMYATTLNTIESYAGYLAAYPNGSHAEEAQAKIDEKKRKRKDDIIEELKKDINARTRAELHYNGITLSDLYEVIPDEQAREKVLDKDLFSADQPNLDLGEDSAIVIPKGYTEVYFWGVPSSGKTCTMATILAAADKMGAYKPGSGGADEYMDDLKDLFTQSKKATILPVSTQIDKTQYLPLTLMETRKGQNLAHKVSIIELSGEVFELFRDASKDKHLEKQKTFKQILSYLNDKDNPKYHFFVLDCDSTHQFQSSYLQRAALYFEENNIFNENTQGISIILTKADRLIHSKDDANNITRIATDYVKENLSSFTNQMISIVGPGGLQLNDGSIPVIPMSIGDVYFKDLCIVNTDYAKVIVKLLMEYSKVAESDDWKKKALKKAKKIFNQ